MIEALITDPAVTVTDSEYRRLLGYPPGHEPGAHALELAANTRSWFAAHGRPWMYLREVSLDLADGALHLDGVAFHSRQLHEHLRAAGARRAVLVAVSAGRAGEAHARQLWQESKPDEYFFTEVFGSAVVEQLVASLNGRVCDLAERDGLMAIPHYSPGYAGWDVAEQNKLFELITRGATQPFPEPLEVLASGMLRPKKSLLAVVGLTERALASAPVTPCETCSFSPCRYRRMPYRHDSAAPAMAAPPVSRLTREASYTVNARALRKWAHERVQLERRDDGSVLARFRFDGTTCSNLGRPLAFDYCVTLAAPEENHTIREADCRPAPGDEGHTFMCAYLNDAVALMDAIATEKPLLGRPLADVLSWSRTPAPSGCHCDAASRAHKWGLALEAIHFALAQQSTPASPRATATLSSP